MKIGLIDADLLDGGTRFPNLALMKLSAYYKARGHHVELINYNVVLDFDRVYLSKVFSFTEVPINLDLFPNIEYGGSGFYFDKSPSLPDEIEHYSPDYSLYQDFVTERIDQGDRRVKWKYYLDYSVGFTTRGCFRQCDFCINKDKTKVVKHSPIVEFLAKDKKYISLLDDNILASPDWKEIIQGLLDTGKPFAFKQGLDLRLMTEEKAKLLASAKYRGDYIFAFDDYAEKDLIVPKLRLWRENCHNDTKLYLLVAYKSKGLEDIVEAFKRIKILMKYASVPYVMRFEGYKDSEYRGMYVNLAGWCNVPHLFKKKTFREFSLSKNPGGASERYMKEFEKKHPEIATRYFDMRYDDLREY